MRRLLSILLLLLPLFAEANPLSVADSVDRDLLEVVYQRGVEAFKNNDFARASSLFLEAAKGGHAAAQYEYGL